MEVSKLFLRNVRTSNLSAKESSYQMGFDTFLTLPQSESVKNFETSGLLGQEGDAPERGGRKSDPVLKGI